MSGREVLLAVEDVSISFPTDAGLAKAVEGVSFVLHEGETVGIVGESGSGKSMTAMAIMGLLPKKAVVTGSIRFRGQELVGLSDEELREIRGNDIAIVFQDALTALNPVMRVGDQLIEAVRVHRPESTAAERRTRAVELLDLVGIPSPDLRVDRYPHEFSGGMRQRVMIAMSIANEPDLLIADEPTTALDVTVQAQVLEVLREVQRRTGTTVLLITHDLGVVAGTADRVLVMYAGGLVETADVDPLFYETAHPYTAGLLASLPRIDRRASRDERLYQIAGQPPVATAWPAGCRFAPRCAHAVVGLCDVAVPEPVAVGEEHTAACVRVGEWQKEIVS
ncbi:ABC transporter ATP-binding protein [Microbacterium sp. KSW4-16]|uniref:ABC transporter ATP-binding protein n=1 Tax=Microbacterium aurugineum TaxID=2851642 RepID=UPI0020C006D4|nr:ABC transporter ATP-binding protein [Microbacterium aurugineum]MCK8467516.1 ABC transporter ATP-binding protein [Microbacterium aurugineum]